MSVGENIMRRKGTRKKKKKINNKKGKRKWPAVQSRSVELFPFLIRTFIFCFFMVSFIYQRFIHLFFFVFPYLSHICVMWGRYNNNKKKKKNKKNRQRPYPLHWLVCRSSQLIDQTLSLTPGRLISRFNGFFLRYILHTHIYILWSSSSCETDGRVI